MKSEPWPSLASKSLLLPLLLLLLQCSQRALSQSNYVQHGDSGNYSTNGLPEEATLDGKVSVPMRCGIPLQIPISASHRRDLAHISRLKKQQHHQAELPALSCQ